MKEPQEQNELAERLALKRGIDISIYKKIVYASGRLVKKTIMEGNLEAILINGFIKFSVHKNRKEKLTNAVNKIKEKRNGIKEH